MNFIFALLLGAQISAANVFIDFDEEPAAVRPNSSPVLTEAKPAHDPYYRSEQPYAGNGSGEMVGSGTVNSSAPIGAAPPAASDEQSQAPSATQNRFRPKAPQRQLITPRFRAQPKPDLLKIIDCPGCRFKQCDPDGVSKNWAGLDKREKIEKIVSNVATVNHLHKTNLDPRFMACLGNRESTMNPMVTNCSSTAAGMFQVLVGTSEFAVARGSLRSRLAGYTNIDGVTYHQKMAESSLAQTELSLFVLATKAKMVGESQLLYSDSENAEDYAKVARAYYGVFRAGDAQYENSLRYQAAIKGCYQCMTASMTRDGKINGHIESCLARAKQ